MLNKLQQKILQNPADNVFVESAAASGKTLLLIEKIKQVAAEHKGPVVAFTFTTAAAGEINERLGDFDKANIFVGTIHAYCLRLLLAHGVEKALDYVEEQLFDSLFQLLKDHLNCIEPVYCVLCDEMQDCNADQFEFIFDLLQAEKRFCCYDKRQCQPTGTKVLLEDDTYINIEDLKIGDTIMGYNHHLGRCVGGKANNAIHQHITDISKTLINEELVKVTLADGTVTQYTYNHQTFASLRNLDEYNFLTYLMCDKNNRFRVGTSQFKNSNSTPWRAKMRAEGCEKIWILDSFKTNKESRVLENKISYLYQIPQITFQLNKTSFSQEDIDYIYDGLDTYTSAVKCLQDFHRHINYPFASLNDNINYINERYNVVYACNLLPHNMTMIQYARVNGNRRIPINIQSIEYVNYNGYVYGLNVEDSHGYIADGIATHNCIYRWRDAHPEYIDYYIEKTHGSTMYMDENYRNGKNILTFAKSIIQQAGYEYRDYSVAVRDEPGRVITVDYSPLAIARTIKKKGNYKDWFILARTNDQVDEIIFFLEKEGVPASSFKRAQLTNAELYEKLKSDDVKVLTIHTSKGLEASNVVVVGARFYNLEEKCIGYVAATRARDLLVWAQIPTKPKRAKMMDNWEN